MSLSVDWSFWEPYIGSSHWPGGEILAAIVSKFLGRIDVVDPDAIAALAGKPCLYLANHQVIVESLIFALQVSPLAGRRIAALAKSEHRGHWPGRLLDLCFSWPGVRDPGLFLYFDRQNPDVDEVFGLVERWVREQGGSVLVHVEGTRRGSARLPVRRISPLWIDLATAHGWPIVPVRFIGGLPVEVGGSLHEFPVGYGTQTIRIGRPLPPRALGGMTAIAALTKVRAAINELSDARSEQPEAHDPELARAVDARVADTGVDATTATIFESLPLELRRRLLAQPPGNEWCARAARFFLNR